MKNASLLTGVLSSRLEKKRERLFSDKLLFICGSVYGSGPSAMERFSFANEAGKNVDSFKRLVKTICFPRHFVEIF